MGALLEHALTLVGLATVLTFAYRGWVGPYPPAEPMDDVVQRIDVTTAAAEAAMYQTADRSA